MNLTNQLGEITELRCRLDFVKRGIVLSQPTNPSSRYDFIAEINHKLIRIQCKTCHLEENNRISFSVISVNWNSKERHTYLNDIDYFYTNWQNKGFLIPITECSETNKSKSLRLGKPEEYSYTPDEVLYADDYDLDKILSTIDDNFTYEIIDIETADRAIAHTRKKYFCIDCGAPVNAENSRCQTCYNKFRRPKDMPTREELKNMIRTIPFTQIASQYKRTDNAIRKWCDNYNLPRTKTEINKISDSDWINI